jgi:acyl-CoA thioesterase-1
MNISSTLLFTLVLGSVFTLSCSLVAAKPAKILFLGDSLSEGYGINKKYSYPLVVQSSLKKQGVEIAVLNGSVSGSTTASCASRLRWFAKASPDFVFIALGGNDGLRGIPVSESKKNLRKCTKLAQEKGMTAFLTGMMVPPNYGPDYSKEFKEMYTSIAKDLKVDLMPFLLVDVAGEKTLNQEDGIHPNKAGHKVMGENVAKFLAKNFKKK